MQGFAWRSYLPFALLITFVACFYIGWLVPTLQRIPYFTWDGYRDGIAARNLLEGGSWWSDPVLAGFAMWYPPLNAWLASTVSALFSTDLMRVYIWSPVALNWITLLALYGMSARWSGSSWGGLVGALTAFAMPWYVTYVLAFPTVMAHAVGFGLLVLLFYVRSMEAMTVRRAVLLGGALAILGWYHPPTFVIVTACIALHSLWERLVYRASPPNVLFAIAIGIVATSPYWVIQLSAPIQNPAPMNYISPAMMQVEMIIPGVTPNPFVSMWLGSAIVLTWVGIGLIHLIKHGNASRNRLLIVMALVAVIGQALAYAKSILPWLPVLLPHEFQLFGQLILCMIAACAVPQLVSWKTHLGTLGLCSIALVFAIHTAQLVYLSTLRCHAFCEPRSASREWDRAVEFIRESIPVDAVIASPDDETAFFVVGVQTGRKSVVTFATHMNPRADHDARSLARDTLFTTRSRSEFDELSNAYEIEYVLASRRLVSPEQMDWLARTLESVYTSEDIIIFSVSP